MASRKSSTPEFQAIDDSANIQLAIIQKDFTQKSTTQFVLYADFLPKTVSKILIGMYLKNASQLILEK